MLMHHCLASKSSEVFLDNKHLEHERSNNVFMIESMQEILSSNQFDSYAQVVFEKSKLLCITCDTSSEIVNFSKNIILMTTKKVMHTLSI